MIFETSAKILSLVGQITELTGVVISAYEYARVPKWQLAEAVVYALWRDRRGTDVLLTSSDLGGVRREHFVQGLVLTCLGILLHVVGGLAELGAHLVHTEPLRHLEQRQDPPTGKPSGRELDQPINQSSQQRPADQSNSAQPFGDGGQKEWTGERVRPKPVGEGNRSQSTSQSNEARPVGDMSQKESGTNEKQSQPAYEGDQMQPAGQENQARPLDEESQKQSAGAGQGKN